MIIFFYKAKKANSKVESGEISANSRVEALGFLKEQGFFVLSLKEKKKKSLSINFLKKIPKKNIISFTRQLSIILKSKITLIESLRIIILEIKHERFKNSIIDIVEKIKAGVLFSSALKGHVNIFGEFYIGLIEMGEKSGRLSNSLFILANHLEKEQKFKSKIKSAIAYPVFLIFMIIATIGVVFLYVFPEILMPTLEAFGTELPLLTVLVMSFSNFLVNNILLIFLIAFIIIIFLVFFNKTKQGKSFIHRNVLRLPFFGNFLKKIYMAQFSKNFLISLSSGLSIIEALKVTSNIIPNVSYKEALLEVRKKISAGIPLSSAVKAYPSFFSSFFVQMLIVGEKTGLQKESLSSISDFYDNEVDETIDLILKLVEPIMMLFLGAIVLLVVLSVFLPIMQMTMGVG